MPLLDGKTDGWAYGEQSAYSVQSSVEYPNGEEEVRDLRHFTASGKEIPSDKIQSPFLIQPCLLTQS